MAWTLRARGRTHRGKTGGYGSDRYDLSASANANVSDSSEICREDHITMFYTAGATCADHSWAATNQRRQFWSATDY